jgi:cell division septum initiation protein DivIVA
MAPRLKVFVTSDGLTDYVVAASSKPKALAAWGSHQDLFKTGLAHETDDPDLVAAATAKPGEVLRRPAGTLGELAKLKPAKKPAATAEPAKPATASPAPSKAALKKVADLEARLAELDAEHARGLRELERKRAELEREAESLEAEHAAKREKFEAALSAARRALG